MDGDPAVEPELDGFSRVLPLPYRVALIIVLGTYVRLLLAPCAAAASRVPSELTCDHRHMGMGPQPALPLPNPHRRPLAHPLPLALLTTPPPAPSLLLPHRNLPLHPPRPLAPSILDPHKRQPDRHCSMGNPTEPLPPRPRHRLHRAPPLRLARRTQPHPRNLKTHKHRRHSGSRGRQIRRHPPR